MSTRIEEIARWVNSVSYDDIPSRVIERAKYQILNTVAAAHAGAISPSSVKLLDAVRKWDAGGDFPVVATGDKMSLHGALFANAALSMAHDFDDYLFLGHSGHSAVFASLLAGMAEKKNVREVLCAQVIGNEISGRLGAACVIGPQNGQMWTHIHIAGTAAIAAKLMGMDAKGIAHAIAIGYYQPAFAMPPGFMGPDTKLLSAAQTSLAGLMAAELAREGFTGPLDIFENPRGFLAQFSYAPMEFMLSGWGKSWVTDSIAYKVVPGCAYIDTMVDALKMILEKFRAKTGRDMTPADVREIEVKASLLTIAMNHLSEDHVGRGSLNPIALNFSIPANAAIVILTGDLKVEHLDPDWLELHRDDILALCRRTRLDHDWEMSVGVTEAMSKVLDLGRVVDAVGMTTLIKARRRAAAHFGTGVTLGLKDLLEMRRQTGQRGKDYFNSMASGALKKLIGGKRPAHRSGRIDLGECDFSKFRMPFAAQVTVRGTDWKEYTARQDIPWGGPGQPWDDTARRVEDKFSHEAGRHLAEKQIKWVVENLERLEESGPINKLMENIVPAAKTGKRKTGAVTTTKDERKEKTQRAKTGTKPPRARKKSEEFDLPPISIEPLSPPSVKTRPAKRKSEAVPAPKSKKPASSAKSKPRSASVALRPAAPHSRAPRPPKGVKRRRQNRP